jgi:Ino eighty subunit 2
VPTIKLKIGKDKLRQATSAWTPPPGAADIGAGPTAATATPDSTAASIPKSNPRGRKVILEDSDEDDDEEDDDESKMDEDEDDQDNEGEELNDEDAEGETDEEMVDSDTNDNTPGTDFMSRTATPDMSRLTNRQRTRLGGITTDDLLELPSGFGVEFRVRHVLGISANEWLEKPGSKNVVTLSAHEQELKRAEMARRRKNLTDQKLQEEKVRAILAGTWRFPRPAASTITLWSCAPVDVFVRWTQSTAFSKSRLPRCVARAERPVMLRQPIKPMRRQLEETIFLLRLQ